MNDNCIDHENKSVNSKQRFLSETTTNIQPSQSIYLKSIDSTSSHVLTESPTSSELIWSKGNSSDEKYSNKSSSSSSSSTKIGQSKQEQSMDNVNSENWPKNFQLNMQNSLQKKKRMRTSFKHQQLRIMKAYFQLNQNPDSKELKELSERTSLSKRTLQVWFQNSRAKQRKTSTGHSLVNNTKSHHEKLSKHSKNNSDKSEAICFDYDYDEQEDNEDNNDDECSDGDDDTTAVDDDNDNFMLNKGNDSVLFNTNQYFY